MIVDGDRERLLGGVLPDYVALEEVTDLGGFGELVQLDVIGVSQLLLDDLVAQIDALVTDVDARPGNELLDLLLRLPTEGALQ